MNKQKEFLRAVEKNDISSFNLLLSDKEIDPAKDANAALRTACEFGYEYIFKKLIEDSRTNPADLNNYAFRFAILGEHVNIAKILINDSRVDPTDVNHFAFTVSWENKLTESLKLLFKNTKIKSYIKIEHPDIYKEMATTFTTNKLKNF